MSSDHFDKDDYIIGRRKKVEYPDVDNTVIGLDVAFKRMPQPRTATGTSNALVVTIADGPAAYDGYQLFIKAASDNTGATTVDYNGSGAVAVTLSDGTALSGGELKAGHYALLIYNGTGYDLVATAIPNASITADKMELIGTQTDGYVWAWNTAAGKMEWVANGSGIDTGEVRLVDGASTKDYLANLLSDGLEILGGLLAGTGEVRLADASSPMAYLGDILERGLTVDGGKLGSIVGQQNLFINPEMTVDQIGGSSGTAIATNSYGFDGWKALVGGTITKTGKTVAITGTGAVFGQSTEELAEYDGEAVTISCTAGTVEILAGAGAGDRTVAPSTPYTFTLSMSFGINFIKIGEGTSCTGLKIEPGTVNTPFQRRKTAKEELLCFRYFWKAYPYTGRVYRFQIATVNFHYTTETILDGCDYTGNIRFPVKMSSVPVIQATGKLSNEMIDEFGVSYWEVGNTTFSQKVLYDFSADARP